MGIVNAPVRLGAGRLHGPVALQEPHACSAVAVENHFTAGEVFADPSQHRHAVGGAQVGGQPLGDDEDGFVARDIVEQVRIGDRGGDGVQT